MDERTAAVQALALREAQQSTTLHGRTVAVMWTLWRRLTLGAWYGATPGQQTGQLAQQAREVAGGQGAAYMREVLGVAGAAAQPSRLQLPPARGGVDLAQVYDRPAEAFRRRFAVTEDVDEALKAAEQRLQLMVDLDLQAARRDGEHQMLTDTVKRGAGQAAGPRVIGTRRIIHPELSAGGVCGLCIAASDRIYTVAELRAIHARCKCTTAVVTEDYDPGELNDVDLGALYDAAGSTDGRELKKTRWQINEHGELGPVLTREGDNFQRQGDAPKGDPVDRAVRELAALEPVLVDLERRAAAGQDVTGPLTYQRDRVDLLRRVAA